MNAVRTKLSVRAATALVSVLVALAMAELALRQLRGPRVDDVFVHRRSSDPELIYELTPRSEGRQDGMSIVINAAGFRDDEFPERPTGGMRIVVLGDSVAWGWGVPMADAFPQVLEQRLHALGSEPFASSVVFNLAVDGYSTRQELRLLETRGLAFDPDLVILGYVLNDPDTADGGLAECLGDRIELLDLTRRAMLRAGDLILGRPKEYHHRIHARYGDETVAQFRRLGEISRERHVPILVAVIPAFRFDPDKPYPWQDLHDLVRGLCEANGLLCLDLYPRFKGRDLRECAFDIWHPSASGHAVIAEALLDCVKALPPVR